MDEKIKSLVNDAISKLSLQSISLQSQESSINEKIIASSVDASDFQMGYKHHPANWGRGEVQGEKEDEVYNVLRYSYVFEAKIIDPAVEEDDPLYVIFTYKAVFSAEYIVPDAYPSDDEIDAFGRHNVPFNLWSYWREHFQSSLTRSGLPSVLVPLFRVDHETTKENG